jgi:carbonic anhydrase
MDILGLKPGEAAIYRNIGGRINAALVATLILLPIVTKAVGQEMGPG